ncbi:hypothetical protein [Sphingobacterium sp. UDSM-2020]|uniref:hypothetical protein n=1 Tax=Sphingobacterium sp. UDSM-2020 TaxID=2795738 RepID=UPI00193555F5|nr:hypothetical protein [Sphingobacterium sp. UDSM-2020]QQD16051.1 hypothetical protein JAZ75_11250 [Sphingobacterium sp. UDSM-2020]
MQDLKRKLLLSYLQTMLQLPAEKKNALIERALPITRIQPAIKYQTLELPGTAETGRAWLSPHAMVHAYYVNENTQRNVGTYIWSRNEPVLFHSSLYLGQERNHSVQMLEAGPVLSMSYEDLKKLRVEFPEIAQHLEQLSTKKEQTYQRRIILLSEPTETRIRTLEDAYPEFCNIASSTVKAIHVGLCRQTYNAAKRKMNKRHPKEPDERSDS